MGDIGNLRIRSLTSDHPRIDAVMDPKEPCVKGPVAEVGELAPDAIAKLSKDELAGMVGEAVAIMQKIAAEYGETDPEMAGLAMEAAKTLAAGLARRIDRPSPGTAEEPMEEALSKHILKVRTIEAGRVAFALLCREARAFNAEDRAAGRLDPVRLFRARSAAGLFE